MDICNLLALLTHILILLILSLLSKHFFCLLHLIYNLYFKWTIFFTSSTSNTFTCMMLKYIIMILNCFRYKSLCLNQIQIFIYICNFNFHSTRCTVTTIHAMSMKGTLWCLVSSAVQMVSVFHPVKDHQQRLSLQLRQHLLFDIFDIVLLFLNQYLHKHD